MRGVFPRQVRQSGHLRLRLPGNQQAVTETKSPDLVKS